MLNRNKRFQKTLLFQCVIFGCIFITQASFPSGSAFSQDEKQSAPLADLERGIGQYKHENYDEALGFLLKAREESPDSTLAAYYLGLTYKQLQRYDEALPNLRDAVTRAPKIIGALIELIDCLYQLGKLDEAKSWISEAEKEGIRPAQVAFLKGLVLGRSGSYEEALASFDKASSLDPDMRKACDYQKGMILVKAKKYADAAVLFQTIIARDPNSTIAAYANEYMDALGRRMEQEKPIRINAGIAWQYDDNVILKPDSADIASTISGQGDSREVYTASIEYDGKFLERYALKGLYSFYYGKQNDLGFYDTMSHAVAVQPSVSMGRGLLAFPTSYTYTSVNDKGYLSAPAAGALYNIALTGNIMAQLYSRYQYKDYLWTPSADDENRDGNDLAGGIACYIFFAKQKGFINLRYALNREWTDGNNWNYLGNRCTVTALVPITDKLNLTVSGDLYDQDFTRSHSIYHVYRKDNTYTLSTMLAYKFYKDSEFQIQYVHVKDDSNVNVYGYSRNIYSAGVSLKF